MHLCRNSRHHSCSCSIGVPGIPAFIFCLFALFVTVGHPPADLGDERPLAPPPEILQKAENFVAGLVMDAMGLHCEDDHNQFLSDLYWPCNLSGNTTNITA